MCFFAYKNILQCKFSSVTIHQHAFLKHGKYLIQFLLKPHPKSFQIPLQPQNVLLHVLHSHLSDAKLRRLLSDGTEEILDLENERMNGLSKGSTEQC